MMKLYYRGLKIGMVSEGKLKDYNKKHKGKKKSYTPNNSGMDPDLHKEYAKGKINR